MSATKTDLAFSKTFDTPEAADRAVELWVAPIAARYPGPDVCRYFVVPQFLAGRVEYGVMLFRLNDDIPAITTMALRSGFNVMS